MKINYLIIGLLICAFSAHNSLASDITTETNGAGLPISIAVDGVPGAQPIQFNPSSNVNMLGESDETSFAISAWHTQAATKASGQAYLMAADQNKMFFMDISSGGEAVPTVAATNFADFAGEWNTM